jgi:hypothetical protein
MLAVLEILFFIYGVCALIFGWLTVGPYWTTGVPARIAAVFLVLPVPLTIIIILAAGMGPEDFIKSSATVSITIVEWAVTIACYAAAYIIVQANHAPDDTPTRRRKARPRFDDEDDDEDDYDPDRERSRRDREEREARRKRKRMERERRQGVERLEEAGPEDRDVFRRPRRDDDDDRPRRRDDDEDDRPRRRDDDDRRRR